MQILRIEMEQNLRICEAKDKRGTISNCLGKNQIHDKSFETTSAQKPSFISTAFWSNALVKFRIFAGLSPHESTFANFAFQGAVFREKIDFASPHFDFQHPIDSLPRSSCEAAQISVVCSEISVLRGKISLLVSAVFSSFTRSSRVSKVFTRVYHLNWCELLLSIADPLTSCNLA